MTKVTRPGAVQLPGLAYSPSWFAAVLQERTAGVKFIELLRRLAPDRYARLEEKLIEACYMELRAYISTLFPIIESCFEDAFELEMEECRWLDIDAGGIPVDCLGVEIEEDIFSVFSEAVAVCLCFKHDGDYWRDCGYGDFACLADYKDFLPEPEIVKPSSIKCLPGREWVGPWVGLRDLYEYAHGITGSSFLDVCHSDLYSGLMVLPQWTVDEVRSLQRSWARTEPKWDRIRDLIHYVDAHPRKYLPTLAGVLKRDRKALEDVQMLPAWKGR